MFMSIISKKEGYAYLLKNYPQCVRWLDSELFVVYDYHTNKWIAVAGVGSVFVLFFYSLYAAFLGSHTMFLLQKLRSHMSAATYRKHRSALISLSMQVNRWQTVVDKEVKYR
uniref:Uncharacterized protein n=1 Tax=Caenorhabditis japonica TaxID=281687 RepID=A0A8R1DH42_CAEJA